MSYAVLACNGVDKMEGALAREVGLQVAEATGAASSVRSSSIAPRTTTRKRSARTP